MKSLNNRAKAVFDSAVKSECDLHVRRKTVHDANVIDFGISAHGGLSAGLKLARICTSGLASINFGSSVAGWEGPSVSVHTDWPIAACMASQYAGWQIATDDYFAMGSGPMRAANGSEPLFSDIGCTESPEHVVGVLESSSLPTKMAIDLIAEKCKVTPNQISLALAPTASQAGNVQVVARSVETALHKMHELGFDLTRIESGYGVAPLPPVAKDDLAGIGRTNDSILFGGSVTIWVRGDDESLANIVDKLPSSASNDFGRPFREVFAAYDHDFYKIDKHLFSPAQIMLCNLDTGNSFAAGQLHPELVRESFLG
ncbi:MAG: methenyltetrahydromethanopterin cyclohydrolase [Planctomycetales bacterium]|nr:methenyltetrahydromethanopterin cyclohydrolase [Planctomycetales bacterium]